MKNRHQGKSGNEEEKRLHFKRQKISQLNCSINKELIALFFLTKKKKKWIIKGMNTLQLSNQKIYYKGLFDPDKNGRRELENVGISRNK